MGGTVRPRRVVQQLGDDLTKPDRRIGRDGRRATREVPEKLENLIGDDATGCDSRRPPRQLSELDKLKTKICYLLISKPSSNTAIFALSVDAKGSGFIYINCPLKPNLKN